jgi:inosine-uridine nucleoside N-ribohydrolase
MTETTREIAFREILVEQRSLLIVAPGVQVATALREAADLEDAVRRLLVMGTETGIDGSIAYLCEFALEMANALRRSTEEDG